MIAYFPAIYPDELIYSQLARYCAKSGYLAYTYAAEELFVSKTVRPDMEFVNTYTPVALKMITRNMPIEDLVVKHTMFPYYGRFLPKERREKAFQALVDMQGNYHNLLPIPKSKGGNSRYLRYCPICVEKDKELYGETFWHCSHQMIGLPVCHIHSCYLINSDVVISGKAPPMLIPAEQAILSLEVISTKNEIESRIATYMWNVFQADMDIQSDISVGQLLNSCMSNTKYRSVRGEHRNIRLLHLDFIDFYKQLSDNRFTELWQIQKILTGDRINFYEICLLSMFLGIPPNELCRREINEKPQHRLFDEKVYRLRDEGMKYPEIAKWLNASYDVVKAIGERRYGTYHKCKQVSMKCGAKSQDWNKIDENTLPLVKKAIGQLQGDGSIRPKKVTVFAVEKALNLSGKQISLHLPKCLAEIKKFEETQEQYWAKEVVWAARLIEQSECNLSWRKIRDLTNMRRSDFERCLRFVDDYADFDLSERLANLLV